MAIDTTAPADLTHAPRVRAWSRPARFGFRFLFSYLTLFFFPVPSGLSDPEWASDLFDPLWARLAPWFAEKFLHLTVAPGEGGSGDTTFDWVRILCMLILALIAAVIWSALDRKRRNYTVLAGWMLLFLRYALALSMLTYGFAKLFKLQFPDPGSYQLAKTYGDSSPMNLLWTFMGFSTGYTMFAGAGEALGGLLLFFRRTTALGAMVVVGVMSNVVMLNFCYDVPVKLGSSHLLFAALVLLAPDLKKLTDLFVRNRSVRLTDQGPHLTKLWMTRAAWALKFLILGSMLWLEVSQGIAAVRSQRKAPTKAYEGSYTVTAISFDGQPVTAQNAADHGWTELALKNGTLRIFFPDRSQRVFKLGGSPELGPVALTEMINGYVPNPQNVAGKLQLDVEFDGTAQLSGVFERQELKAALVLRAPAPIPLLDRGFHWVSEEPYNR